MKRTIFLAVFAAVAIGLIAQQPKPGFSVTGGAAGGGGGSNFNQTWTGAGPMGSGSNTTSQTQRAVTQGRDNISFDDDGTNTILNFTPLDARIIAVDEEFLSTNAANNTAGTHGWSLASVTGTNTLTSTVSTWPNLGVLTISAGTATPAQGNGAIVLLGGTPAPWAVAFSTNTGWGLQWVFALGQTLDTRFRAGMAQSNVIDPLNSFGICWDTNAATCTCGAGVNNFCFYVKPGSGADVVVDTGVAADTNFHTLLVYSTVAGVFRMSLDGGPEKTFCAAGGGCDGTVVMPTGSQVAAAQCMTDTALLKTCRLDAFKFKARVASGATNKRN
jgi:hypothetical protein